MKTKIVRAGLVTLLLILLTGALVVGLSGGGNGRFAITSGGGQIEANGLGDEKIQNNHEIGGQVGLSGERIRQIQNQIRKKLLTWILDDSE